MHGRINDRDRPLSGVHRADQPHDLGQLEVVVGTMQHRYLTVPVFEQEKQCTEHPWKVRPMALVDHHHVLLFRVLRRTFQQLR